MPYVSDDFTRADSNTTLGTSTSGDAWTASNSSVWGISSNAAQVQTQGTSNRSQAWVELGTAVHDVSAKVLPGNSVSRCGVMVRYSDASNYIVFLGYTGATATLYKNVAGTFTALANSAAQVASGQIVRVTCLADDTIKVYQNGTLRITATDSFNNTATKAGLHLDGTGKVATWDDFYAYPVQHSAGMLMGSN